MSFSSFHRMSMSALWNDTCFCFPGKNASIYSLLIQSIRSLVSVSISCGVASRYVSKTEQNQISPQGGFHWFYMYTSSDFYFQSYELYQIRFRSFNSRYLLTMFTDNSPGWLNMAKMPCLLSSLTIRFLSKINFSAMV